MKIWLRSLVTGRAGSAAGGGDRGLREEKAELKRQLGRNSQNWSKPPSTDSPFTKPAPKSLRRKSGRKPGGQQGIRAGRWSWWTPDETLRHEPGSCSGCGTDLAGQPWPGWSGGRYSTCPDDGAGDRAPADRAALRVRNDDVRSAPEGVTARVSYGPRITAIILYLYVGQSCRRNARQALAELFGTPVSEGTVAACPNAPPAGSKRSRRHKRWPGRREAAGFDESGLRVAAKLHWVHCARTDNYT